MNNPDPAGPALAAAQQVILDDLTALELLASELYALYASLHPASAALWTALSREEQLHAAMLKKLQTLLAAGHIFWNLGDFSRENLADEVRLLQIAINRARRGDLPELDCLKTALRLENSAMESRFYSTVRCDSKEFALIAEAMTRSSAAHSRRLQDRYAELTTGRAAAQK